MDNKTPLDSQSLAQTMVALSLGLLVVSVAIDLLYLVSSWSFAAVAAHGLVTAGLVAGMSALPWTWADLLATPPATQAKWIDITYEATYIALLMLFALSWWLRQDPIQPASITAYIASTAGAILTLPMTWLIRIGTHEAAADSSAQTSFDARQFLDVTALE